MPTPPRLAPLVLLALLLPLLIACGGGAPATMASIPVYPEATEIQPGENSLVDTVADSMQSAGGSQLSAEMRRYSLPAGTTWDEVSAYFTEQLAGSDWQAAANLAGTNEALSTAGWQRGGGAEQVLLVGLLPEELAEAPVLIVALFSE